MKLPVAWKPLMPPEYQEPPRTSLYSSAVLLIPSCAVSIHSHTLPFLPHRSMCA